MLLLTIIIIIIIIINIVVIVGELLSSMEFEAFFCFLFIALCSWE